MTEENLNLQEQTFTLEDIEKNKTMAGLAYLLFFLPLIVCPESRFAKFHANQALILVIVSIAGSIILGIIPVIGWVLLPFFWVSYTSAWNYGFNKWIWRQSQEVTYYWEIRHTQII